MTTRSVYVAGPMRGHDSFNFPAFDAAAAELRADGWEVFSPAEHDRDDGFDETLNSLEGFDLRKAFQWDVEKIFEADAIYMLRGWETSAGATLEKAIAEFVGSEVLYQAPENILEEANRLVHGDRQAAYGHPIDDFTRTGRMWAAILGVEDVTPEHVGLCMVAVKLSRQVNAPKRDNLVDAAGYAATVAMVDEERKRRLADI